MDKAQISISAKDWGNLITKYRPESKRVSIADFTDGTVNIDTDVNGTITKRKGGTVYNPTPLAAAPKDQYEAIFSDGTRHLLVVQSGEVKYSSGDSIFNTVINGSGFSTTANFEFATTQDRVYGGNSVDDPQVYDRATSYGGVSYTAPQMKDMGLAAPLTAPTAGAPTAGGNVPNGAHTYKVTFLYYDSEESNGSPASAVQTAGAGNNTIPLTTIPIGGYGVTARKIYRDNNDGLWLHLDTITDNTTTIYTDILLTGTTPTPIPEFNNEPPLFGLITLWLDKLWVSKVPGDPYTLFYSETGLPDIFRPENQILCNQEDPITGHIVYFDRLIVFNRKSFGQILGKTSDTFRYSAIPSSVGCVDNRTIQIRVVEGVPILIWLSDRGFYSYDGSSINYISDWIEDLVNFNIQQALQQRGANTQTSQTHFQAGTASQGIDLISVPGSITTKGYSSGTSLSGTNPRRNLDDQTDWENGTTETNVVTKDGTNQLKSPTRFAPDESTGTLTNMIVDAGQLKLSVEPDFTGEGRPTVSTITVKDYSNNTLSGAVANHGAAWPLRTDRSGTITGITIQDSYPGYFTSGTNTLIYKLKIWDSAGNAPNVEIFASSNQTANTVNSSNVVFTHFDFPVSVPITGGQTYWIGWQVVSVVNHTGSVTTYRPREPFPFFSVGLGVKLRDSGGWKLPSGTTTTGASSIAPGYAFCQSAVPNSGQWLSDIYDTFSDSISPTLNLALTSTLTGAAQCSGSYTLSNSLTAEGSNDSLFLSGAEVSETVNNLNGNQNISISGKRYWRLRLTLSTTDDRVTPIAQDPILKFETTSTWISETIDTTADVVSYDSLDIIDSQPVGTSIVYTVSTSNDDITYPDGFVTFGTEVVRRYIRIRAILTTTTDNITTPTISSIILKWTLTSNLISSGIDTGVNPPAGWDTFISDFDTNGNIVTFEMRSATTLGGLTAATFYPVTSGSTPVAVPVNQFVQWRVTITSSDNSVPQVDSVTVQWLISNVDSIRPASIFVDGRYYVAVALPGETVNTVLLEFDLNGKWRRHNGLSIATFSFFFNRPYLGLATAGTIVKFLETFQDYGNDITVDIRTRAIDFSTNQFDNNSEKVKVVGEVVLEFGGTGAEFEVSYSVDEGQTFTLFRTNSGATSFTVPSDGKNYFIRLRPEWDAGASISGRTILYRIVNSDENEVEFHSLKATAFVRRQSPVITG